MDATSEPPLNGGQGYDPEVMAEKPTLTTRTEDETQ